MSNEENEKVEGLLASSHLYQFFSNCLFEPDKGLLELLNDKEYMDEVKSCLGEIGNDKLSESFGDLQKQLQSATLDDLLGEYLSTFGSETIAVDCPTYEMFFGRSHIFQQTHELADISGFYRAFGLEVSKDDTANRWDHIAVELEFLHFLTYKQAYAMENHSHDQMKVCLKAKKKFLNAHIGKWIQAFAKSVNKKSPSGVYRQVANLANDFVHVDMEQLEVRTEEIDELLGGEPDYLESLEGKSAMACNTCMDEEQEQYG